MKDAGDKGIVSLRPRASAFPFPSSLNSYVFSLRLRAFARDFFTATAAAIRTPVRKFIFPSVPARSYRGSAFISGLKILRSRTVTKIACEIEGHLRSMTSDSIEIAASLEEVWPFVADPVGQATWNEKIVEVRRHSDQAVRLGETFGMTYRMSGKDTPNEVHFRHQYRWKSRFRYAVEKYRLQQQGDCVEVTQEIDLSETGIPWFFRALIWFISRFGKSVGKSNMERLKAAIEESTYP